MISYLQRVTWQIAAVPVAVVTLLVLAVLMAAEPLISRELEVRAGVEVAGDAVLVAQRLSAELDRHVREVQVLARQAGGTGVAADGRRLQADFEAMVGPGSAFAWLGLVRLDGVVQVGSSGFQQGRRLADSAVFEEARQGLALRDVHPAPALAGRLPARPGQPPDVLDIGMPVVDGQGRPIAVLVAHLDWAWFQSLLEDAVAASSPLGAEAMSVAVYTRQFQRLAGRHGAVGDHRALVAQLRRLERGQPATVRVPGMPSLVVARAELIPGVERPALSWQVVVARELEAALRPATQLRQWTLAIAAVLGLVFGGLGYLLSRRIIAPYAGLLRAVSARAAHAERGNAQGLTRYIDALVEQLAIEPGHSRLPDADTALGSEAPDRLLALIARDAHRLRELLTALPVGVMLLDEQGKVLYCNPECERMFGWEPAWALGQDVDQLVDASARQALAPPALVAHPAPAQVRWRHASGRTVQVEVTHRALPLEGQGDELLLLRDVTDRERAERALRVSQRELSELTRQLMDQEKATTRHLAQALHDRLGQTLSALRLNWDALTASPAGPSGSSQAARIDKLLQQAVTELREVLVDLRPPLLDELGLLAALDNELQVRRRDASGIDLVLEVAVPARPLRWPADVEYAAFMIAREAVANALQHARPHEVRVSVDGSDHALMLFVRDDGGGMSHVPDDVAHPGHLGLVGMRERAVAIGAHFEVHTALGQGTVVQLSWQST